MNPAAYAYTSQGRLHTLTTYKDGATSAGAAVTTWTYHSLRGWLSGKTYDDGKGWTYAYTAAGRLYTRTSATPRSITTYYGYNAFGDQTSVEYSDDTQAVIMSYDRRGRLKSVLDAAGLRTINRDAAGQVLSEVFAADAGSATNFLDGVVVSNTPSTSHVGLREAHGVSVSGYPLNAVSFSHDAADRLWRITKDGRRAEFTYNLRTGQQSGLTHSWQSGSTYTPYITQTRTLDNLGRVASLNYKRSSDNAYLSSTDYLYDVYGRRTRADRDMQWGYEKGARWNYGYDELNQLTSAKRDLNAFPGDLAPGQQYEYAYDDIGNRTSTKIGGDQQGNNLVTSTYTSNLLNQYTQRQVPGRIDITGDADSSAVARVNNTIAYRAGRYFWHVIPVNNVGDPVVQDVTTEIIPGDQAWQRFMVAKTPELFTHDADGNLTQDGTFVYEWDGENRLKAMITRSEIGQFITPFRLDFAYDYMGRRIMKRYSQYGGDYHDLISTPGGDLKLWAADYELRFVWDTGLSGGYGNLSASYFTDPIDGTFIGADQSYAWGPDLSGTEQGAGGIGGLAIISAAASVLNPTAATYVPLYDGHGNVVSLRDTSTNELAAYTYGPYGETTAAIGSRWASNPFRFSTKFTDAETGLVYYGYRYYLPSQGRWAGRDPIEEFDSNNVFEYVHSAPVSNVDYLGLYQRDFHYYVIYFVLRSRCWPIGAARIIATESQYVDENPDTEPVVELQEADRARYHFWDSTREFVTHRNPQVLRNELRTDFADADDAGGSYRSLAVIGRWLHTYADTWSHEGFSAYLSTVNLRELQWPPIGHWDTPEGGHSPDLPYNDIGKAVEAGLAIYDIVPSKCECRPGGLTYDTVRQVMWQTFAMRDRGEETRASHWRRAIRRYIGEDTYYASRLQETSPIH